MPHSQRGGRGGQFFISRPWLGKADHGEGLLDTIHQYKPELAESIMVKLDQDPARVYNKRKLQNHLESVKRLAKAGREMNSINDLNREEQRKFFEERLKNLRNGKGQVNAMFDNCPPAPEGYIGIGEYQKAVDYLLGWYRECGYNELTIIDPHFYPQDLHIIKRLADENNDLSIRILTHKYKYTIEDFTSEWRKVSAGVKIPVQVMLIGVVDKPSTGPLHDRYWICFDEENDKRLGISLNSLNGLGKKESAIQPIEDSTALYTIHSYSRYAKKIVKRIDDMELEYVDFTLE